MARLHQSLTGTSLVSIRGLGFSEPEYEEAKERHQLRAYMDQLEENVATA